MESNYWVVCDAVQKETQKGCDLNFRNGFSQYSNRGPNDCQDLVGMSSLDEGYTVIKRFAVLTFLS